MSSSKELSGAGGDLTLHYSNQSIELWLSEGWIDLLKPYVQYGFATHRIGFVFPGKTGMSTLDYTKFSRLLDIFQGINCRVIALMQNQANESMTGYSMSSDLWNNWLQFTEHYKGDPRIAAISLFGEPNKRTIPTGKTALEQTQYFADLTRAIHQIDASRLVIFPHPLTYYSSITTWLTHLDQVGIANDANVVFDVLHPYYFENDYDMGKTPEDKVLWYFGNYVDPAVFHLGANRVWVGETYFWTGKTYASANFASHTPDPNLQDRFQVALMNLCVENDIGFDLWATLGWGTMFQNNINSLKKSHFIGSLPPPPIISPPPTGGGTTPTEFKCSICLLTFPTQEALNLHVQEVHTGTPPPIEEPIPTKPPSQMHLATVCGLSSEQIELLRSFGHEILSKDLQDLYHAVGPSIATYLSSHEKEKNLCKNLLETLLSFIS